MEEKISRGWGGENAYHVKGYRYLVVDNDLEVSRASPSGKVATLAKVTSSTSYELVAEIKTTLVSNYLKNAGVSACTKQAQRRSGFRKEPFKDAGEGLRNMHKS